MHFAEIGDKTPTQNMARVSILSLPIRDEIFTLVADPRQIYDFENRSYTLDNTASINIAVRVLGACKSRKIVSVLGGHKVAVCGVPLTAVPIVSGCDRSWSNKGRGF